jgi:hypothetical protein
MRLARTVLLAAVLVLAGARAQAESESPTLVSNETHDHHPLFDKIDTNHDGVISLDEWEAFRAEHPGKRAHRNSSTTTTTAPSGDGHPLFDKIDTNHDGVISLAEWEAFRASHRHRRCQHPGANAHVPGSGTGANGVNTGANTSGQVPAGANGTM